MEDNEIMKTECFEMHVIHHFSKIGSFYLSKAFLIFSFRDILYRAFIFLCVDKFIPIKTYFYVINFYAAVTDNIIQNVWMKSSLKISLLVVSVANTDKFYVILSERC